ncbi:hypothetical protein HBN50_08070 [Halobacteriovorax sp. GB3]|uniref:hypothetical protein n=1 Tax=Halobacteriovorax sp. GB3 TaxID=2719615 RepID=UPI00235F0224|nr:hypothetical protein [Halobacteriovorax sp. GB3]MDD0853048.1 hypothetical protein [Halobacteriovorax sp. GB3]
MIPSQSDPCWKKLIAGTDEFSFNTLATKMMVTRVRQMYRMDGDGALAEATKVAREFFEKNANIAGPDLELIKG